MTPRTPRTSPRAAASRTSDPYEEQINAAGRQSNPWLIATIILAVALVGALAFAFLNKDSADMEVAGAISVSEAEDTVMNFINTIYGPQIGTSEFVGIVEKNGMYEVTVSVNDPQTNQRVDQVVFMSKDGELFVPTVIDMSDALNQYQLFQQQQQQQPPQETPTTTTTSTDSTVDEEDADTNSNTNVNSNTNSNANSNTNTNSDEE